MRATPLLTVLTVAALASLTGCTGSTVTPAPDDVHAVDLCALAAPPGDASESVIVEGAVGSTVSAAFTLPLAIPTVQRSVTVEGDGEAIGSGDLVEYAMSTFDAATGEQVRSEGYGDAPMLPVPALSVGQFLGCATVGSRVTVAVPETDQDGAAVWVLDVLGSQPARATGADQAPVEGMPGVESTDSGAPIISIPGAAPPADTRVAVLKKGDGPAVAPGDSVMVHYTGARWSNGEVFDSSWNNGAPTAMVTTDLIPGYRQALEGQTVGSQVVVVIPPGSAYGEGTINEEDLTGETLVFVVDILAAVPAS